MSAENLIRVYNNKHYTVKKITGCLLEFIVNELRWGLNYRGDTSLLICRNKQLITEDDMNSLS